MRRQLGAIVGTAALVAATVMGGVAAHAQDGAAASNAASRSSVDAKKAKTIVIYDYSFTTPRWVAPGSRVIVDNRDHDGHTVTGSGFDVVVMGLAKGHFKAPMKPGSYPFLCRYHSNMHGLLVVRKPR